MAMHTAMYADNADVHAVVHTHSPFATAFAVANRPIDCWIEALAMFGLPDGVPVAGYGPRGSEESIANIRAALRPGVPAVPPGLAHRAAHRKAWIADACFVRDICKGPVAIVAVERAPRFLSFERHLHRRRIG